MAKYKNPFQLKPCVATLQGVSGWVPRNRFRSPSQTTSFSSTIMTALAEFDYHVSVQEKSL